MVTHVPLAARGQHEGAQKLAGFANRKAADEVAILVR